MPQRHHKKIGRAGKKLQKVSCAARTNAVDTPPPLGCSQVVRQRFLVPCIVGSNPTTPAIFQKLCKISDLGERPKLAWPLCSAADPHQPDLAISFMLRREGYLSDTCRAPGFGNIFDVAAERALDTKKAAPQRATRKGSSCVVAQLMTCGGHARRPAGQGPRPEAAGRPEPAQRQGWGCSQPGC